MGAHLRDLEPLGGARLDDHLALVAAQIVSEEQDPPGPGIQPPARAEPEEIDGLAQAHQLGLAGHGRKALRNAVVEHDDRGDDVAHLRRALDAHVHGMCHEDPRGRGEALGHEAGVDAVLHEDPVAGRGQLVVRDDAKPTLPREARRRAHLGRRSVIYTLGRWRWIMLPIRLLPEPLFMRLKF